MARCPTSVRHLLTYSGIKTAAEKIGIEAIDRRVSVLNVKFHEETRVDGEKLMALVSGTPARSSRPPESCGCRWMEPEPRRPFLS